MSISETLTLLMNKVRSKTGAVDALTIKAAMDLLDTVAFNEENILLGTSKNYRDVTSNGSKYYGGMTASTSIHDVDTMKSKWYTYAATVTNDSNKEFCMEVWQFHDNKALFPGDTSPLPNVVHSENVKPGDKDKLCFATVELSPKANQLRTYFVCPNGDSTNDTKLEIKEERLVAGKAPGFWSPNPAEKVGG